MVLLDEASVLKYHSWGGLKKWGYIVHGIEAGRSSSGHGSWYLVNVAA